MTHTVQDIITQYKSLNQHKEVLDAFKNSEKSRILLSGLSGSTASLFAASLLKELQGIHFFLFADKEEAAYFHNDLATCIGTESVCFFPSSYKRSIQYGQPESGNIILRTEALNRLNEARDELLVLVSYPEALIEKVISKSELDSNTLHLIVGEDISISFIEEVLKTYQFEEVDFVYEPGQYAIRGSIVDVFSYSSEQPYRVDFFGDEVESIRAFDIDSQLSKQKFDKVSILPNVLNHAKKEAYQSLLKFGEKKICLWSDDLQFIANRLEEIHLAAMETNAKLDDSQLYLKSSFLSDLSEIRTMELSKKSLYGQVSTFEFNTQPQPLFQKNFTLLGDNLKMHLAKNYQIIILSDNEKQHERLAAIFKDTHQGIPFTPVQQILHGGFTDHDLKICCYTDHQIFDRYHKYKIGQYYSGKASVSLQELRALKPGDYVVHIDHGVGRFGGLEKITVNGKIQESIRLVYRDNDVLYVNIHSLHRISKYKGKDDGEPKIHKLGSGAWQKLKDTTKRKVKDIAKDLIALYAQRKSKEGFKFSADTYLQEELEASFIYEDTPDQVKSTQAVKADMESGTPMDRLICGDVGFGKTEVAIRAAFKAVSDSKQVAVLVPTTILALQHATTFQERLKDFPCKVEYISRLRKPADQKRVLKEVKEGNVDILIGTHRLLGKDVGFKDLGLLIIDEEQKFGVSSKEKLRSLKAEVDTLTLTATPIPRTLQFSLMGARDLSILNTPPPNRHPIITELHTFNEAIIQEGINYEVSRGGQVFFIHNRVQNIYEVEAMINTLCPKVKTIVGHGQMEGPKLEKIMIDFINGDYDVLVATTIIESGLDIPNANTIFIHNAQNFGLSDLHQLRGRVGRSNKRAFCYLIAPPLISVTPEARRRLKAIEELSDLGSGFNIAMQDLDIRGAGNMLGAEQSGFIADIGFETYNRILNEAIQELRDNEFRAVFADEEPRKQIGTVATDEDIKYVTDCTVETDMAIHIPESYVSNISERIRLYRKIDNLTDDESIDDFSAELIDRFGMIPEVVKDLFQIVKIRRQAEMLGFEKLILKNNLIIAHFISNQESPYYSSPIFALILGFVQRNPKLFRMKEGKKLTLTIGPIEGLNKVYDLLANIRNYQKKTVE